MIPQNLLTNALINDIKTLHQYEKLAAIFNSLPEIIFTVDIEKGTIENVNNAIQTLGYSLTEWENQKFITWPYSKKKQFLFLLQAAKKSNTKTSNERVLISTKNNLKTIPFEFSSVLYTFKEKKYLLCVLRDISRMEKLMIELEQALKKERELNELRAGFVSTASHQFRTPLTIIQSGIEIMEMYTEGIAPEKQKSFQRQFKRIHEEVERLQNLMNDVLLLGRADANRTPFMPEKKDLVLFCTDLIQNKFNSLYEDDRKILLQVTGKQNNVNFDAKLLDHALENILTNAYKYSTEGNILFQISFEYDKVQISISDNGIGIPEKDLAHLFQPFYRAANTTEIQGTGLGLSIVKDYIDLHNGQIFVVSELNKGTTVTILLPLNINA